MNKGPEEVLLGGEEELKLGLCAYEFILSFASALGWMIENLES